MSPSNIRRSRGYTYEKSVTDRFNGLKGWTARRLGGTTVSIPDVLAFERHPQGSPCIHPIMYAIECKTTSNTTAVIPPDQVNRCFQMCEELDAYKGIPVGAFRFHSKAKPLALRPTKPGIYKKTSFRRRPIQEYFVRLNDPGREYRIKYNGELTSWLGRGYIKYEPEDVMLKMPWERAA